MPALGFYLTIPHLIFIARTSHESTTVYGSLKTKNHRNLSGYSSVNLMVIQAPEPVDLPILSLELADLC